MQQRLEEVFRLTFGFTLLGAQSPKSLNRLDKLVLTHKRRHCYVPRLDLMSCEVLPDGTSCLRLTG